MRKRKQKTVGIYLWKLVLVIVAIFALVISVECFLFIERTVKNWVSGNFEEHNSSINANSNEETSTDDIENSDTTEITEPTTPAESNELNNTTDEPASDDTGSISVASVSEDVVCTAIHTHKTVCYETDISQEDRMVIYNLVDTINSIGTYSSKLSSLKNYVSNYNSYSSTTSTTYYNSYYKSYLYNWYKQVESANTIMTQQVNSTYYNYITNRDQLLELLNLKILIDAFEALDTLPLRYDFTTKINGFKNSSDTVGMINYLTEVSNIYNTAYQKFVALNIDSSMYDYVINYKHLLELQKISNNLSKIVTANNAIKDLPKWSNVTAQINIYKTSSNVTEYLKYLETESAKINTAKNSLVGQNLDTTLNTYVVNYNNYNDLLIVPKIFECAKIIKDLPKWNDIIAKINEYKEANNVNEAIQYLTDTSNTIESTNSLFNAQNLSSSYNTYVINYENFDTINKMYLKDVLSFTVKIKALPICNDVTQKILDFKEKKLVTECIDYIENSVISTNYNEVYNNLSSSKKLTQAHYSYIINYQNLKKLYDLHLDNILTLIKDIDSLPSASEINFSNSKIRSNVISTSQRYTKLMKDNEQLAQYVINYDKLSELETSLSSLDKDISISVQYYAYINIIDNIAVPTNYMAKLNFIDTSGRSMPINRGYDKTGRNQLEISPTANEIKHIYIDSSGNAIYEKQLREVYREHKYKFSRYFEDFYVNNMLKFTTFYDLLETNYELSEIWLLNDDNPDEYISYKYTNDVYFTRNWNDKNPNAIPLTKDSVIRYVYNTKEVEDGVDIPVTFYDYDITSGVIYSSDYNARNNINPIPTSSQTLDTVAYALTAASGINSDENYTGKSGARFGFGNINTGVTHNTDKWTNNGFLNTLSGPNRVGGWGSASNSYQNCVFNIVQGIDNGMLKYSDGIAAPNLFNDGEAIGKKTYTGYSLKFNRTGDRYLLTQVNGTNSTDLDKLVNPHSKYPTIATNNFWPMDDVESYGADGHDLKFGIDSLKTKRNFVGSSNGSFPASDNMDKDHNAYFGMRGEFEFDLSSEYVGPLEWHFYGDDDLWIFLDDQLIIDIGGVHSSVGEYANFWDYLEKGDSGHHKITFFFTERGASGSTCWMRFALPEIVADGVDETRGNLKLEKNVVGADTNENFNFVVTLANQENQELNEYFYYSKYNLDGSEIRTELFKSGDTLSFNKDQYIIIEGIPANTTYSVEETSIGDFIAQSQNATGKIIAAQTLTAKFTNIYDTRSLKVTKIWDDEISPESRPKELQVKLVPTFVGEENTTFPEISEGEIAEEEETTPEEGGEVIEETTPEESEEESTPEESEVEEVTGEEPNKEQSNCEEYIRKKYPYIELEITLDETSNWTYEWLQLPKYMPVFDENGETIIEKKEIKYIVQEVYTNELATKYYANSSYSDEDDEIILENILYRNIEITKVDADDELIKLGDAEFKLEKLKEEDGKWVVDDTFEAITGVTSSEEENLGKLTFSKLKYGKYRLTEVKSPSGYNINKKSIDIEIDEKSELIIQKEITNKKGGRLPFTGGSGINTYATAGCLLVLYVFSNIRRQRAALNRKLKPKRRKKSRKSIR